MWTYFGHMGLYHRQAREEGSRTYAQNIFTFASFVHHSDTQMMSLAPSEYVTIWKQACERLGYQIQSEKERNGLDYNMQTFGSLERRKKAY